MDLVCEQQGMYESIKAEVPRAQELLRDSNFTMVMVGWNGVCVREREQFSNWYKNKNKHITKEKL